MLYLLIGFAKPAMLPATRQIPVGQEMIIFSAPQGPGPKISQRALNRQLFPEYRPQPVLPRVNATFMLGSSLWGRK